MWKFKLSQNSKEVLTNLINIYDGAFWEKQQTRLKWKTLKGDNEVLALFKI